MWFKWLNILMIGVFVLSAFVQFNDPDSLPWIAIYALAALVCGLDAFGKLPWWGGMAMGVTAAFWGLTLIPSWLEAPDPISTGEVFGSMEMKTPAVELTRELGGLAIVSVWMWILAWKGRGSKS